MILVVGATGLLGAEICKQLQIRGQPTRALVRRGSPREAMISQLGVEVVQGDLKEPESVDAACHGSSIVITTANSMSSRQRGDSFESVDRDGSLYLLRAAQRAGVKHFVYTSLSPVLPPNNVFVRYKRELEAAVRASSLTWTILQPSAFMEVHAGPMAGWDFERGRARLMGSGRAQASYMSVVDVAAFAVAAIEHSRGANRVLHITGPEPLTGLEAVAIAERVTGKKFVVQRLPPAALGVLRLALMPINVKLSSLCAMGLGMQADDRVAMEPLLTEFAVRPTTFEQYVRSARASSGVMT
jgi:uncharacterized protein YbjT (DUF2867 family)